ncbi:metal ABC transporter substrate-binding protein [Lactococcus formosensis]|uniref:metal ABC transporter substrate-binding protein n=1 Tax=Lactococcus formosensis TaxID=1281486 RepID=UPI00254A0B5A|nr:metal ABC transporter substrate-binding protein [Lactococcus formosensis]
MNRKQLSLITILASLLLLLTACSPKKEESKASDKLKVVTTYSIIADIAENIGKDHVDVYSMVPRGTDPHQYDPKPNDTQAVEKADIVFYNGLNLETGKGWFDKLVKNSRKEDSTFMVSQGVTPIHLSEKGKESEEDPHAWLDIQNGIIYAQNIEKELSKKDPQHKEVYQKNLKAYTDKLQQLDTEAKAKIATIPQEDRILVTSEGAFKYFSKQYGLTAEYIWEINTDNQGTPAQLNRINTIVKDKNVKALFVETSVSPKTMESVSRQTGVKIYSKIFTDSLADEGQKGDTYYDMLQWNIEHITDGLSGK